MGNTANDFMFFIIIPLVVIFVLGAILGVLLAPERRHSIRKKQNNFCGGCGCSCICNGDCGGDTKKCTSKKSLEKKCNHHCGCYVALLTQKDNKK